MYSRLNDVLKGRESNYMLPFYWQHGDHYETIPLEIERIYQSGCKAFCVESRPHKDFMGEGWWRDMDLILSEAKKRDMQVWILDDDHFPTGNANGHIKKYHPDKRRWDIAERHIDVVGPLNKALLLTNEYETRKILGVYGYKRTGEGDNLSLDTILDFSKNIKDGFCEITVPEGMWRIFFIYKSREHKEKEYYIDMLSRESVRVLVDAVYEPHFEHYKDYFGTTIAGFFSDEPSFGNSWFNDHALDPGIYEYRLGLLGMAYPWSPDVFLDMRENLGIEPLPYMVSLWFDIGEKTSQIRYAYMDAITRLYRDNFTRQIGDWCKSHGVQYIGHVIEDMNAHKRTGYGAGHYFRALDGQHMSGVDIVLHQIMPGMCDYLHNSSTFSNNCDPEFFDYILAKLGSSLAHIGKDMKGRAMCEVFGAFGWAESISDMKYLLDHLLVRGINHFVPHAFSPAFPDTDCPPHFGANGHDPQFEGFSKLMNYANKVSHILYGGTHTCDVAILYDAEFEWMNKENSTEFMQVSAKILYDNNIDYDLLPIDCIVGNKNARLYTAKAENGKLVVGNQSYKALIIPYAPIMPNDLTDKLSELEGLGVKIIKMGVDCTKERFLDTLLTIFVPDIEITGDKKQLRSCHYIDGDNDIYMLVNENITGNADCEVSFNQARSDRGICLDLLNDTFYRVELKDKKLSVSLMPNHSSIYIFGDVDFATLPNKRLWKNHKDADFNFKIELAGYENLDDFKTYKENVNSSELFNITSLDNMPDFSGRARYTANFIDTGCDIGIDLGNLYGNACRLYLNGEDLGIRITEPYFYDLSGKIKNGENQLVIEISNTLANKMRDYFSSFMAIRPFGLLRSPRLFTL